MEEVFVVVKIAIKLHVYVLVIRNLSGYMLIGGFVLIKTNMRF